MGDPDFEPGANKVVPPVTLKLLRAGALSGHVRDAESGKPLRQITVRGLRARWLLGMRRLTEEAIAFSDAGGDFRFEKLTPGEYILEIQNLTAGNSAAEKKYPLIFWPSQGPETLAPLNVQSGGESGVGTIDYAQAVFPKLAGSVVTPCSQGDRTYDISIAQRVGGAFLRRKWRDAKLRQAL